jgi:hypothetical protein
MADATVNWYGERVKVVIKGLEARMLTRVAMIGADKAAINIRNNGQVDTGFMMGTVYGKGPTASGYANTKKSGEYKWQEAKHGGKPGTVYLEAADEVNLPDDETAVIHCAAEYAIYQEMRMPFMYPALQAVIKEFGGIVEQEKIK